MSVHDLVSGNYGRPGLYDDLMAAAARAGLDTANLTPLDISAADQFHIGALEAARTVFNHLGAGPDHHVLDIGSGIGGPARALAHDAGCRVTGVDLTPEFTDTATRLSAAVGSTGVEFRTADATDLPFADGEFDRAMMLHVGMNLPDKAAVFGEVARVLRAGGRFVVFDQTRSGPADPTYPVPWAATPEASFLATEEEYRGLLTAAGFRVTEELDLTADGLSFIARMRELGPQPLGVHVLAGESWPERLGNDARALQDGVLRIVLFVAEAATPGE